jgi:hypothetical protein
MYRLWHLSAFSITLLLACFYIPLIVPLVCRLLDPIFNLCSVYRPSSKPLCLNYVSMYFNFVLQVRSSIADFPVAGGNWPLAIVPKLCT